MCNGALDVLNPASYEKLTGINRRPYVLILKGLYGFLGPENAQKVVDYLINKILQEGDKVLILDQDDLKAFGRKLRRSGFSRIKWASPPGSSLP